jgi:hypothetical protein
MCLLLYSFYACGRVPPGDFHEKPWNIKGRRGSLHTRMEHYAGTDPEGDRHHHRLRPSIGSGQAYDPLHRLTAAGCDSGGFFIMAKMQSSS